MSNLDFETAQIKVEASYAEYKLFWINKQRLRSSDRDSLHDTFNEEQIRYYETEDLYFGFGEVDLFSGYVDKYEEEKLLDFDRKYPGFIYP